MNKFLVERTTDTFESVTAATLHPSDGDLYFLTSDGSLDYAIARGHWITVVKDED